MSRNSQGNRIICQSSVIASKKRVFFCPFLRGNLLSNGRNCFDPVRKTTALGRSNDRKLMMLPNLLLLKEHSP
jgi:hypothetical protein